MRQEKSKSEEELERVRAQVNREEMKRWIDEHVQSALAPHQLPHV